jgi:hypothetical protein
VSETIEKLNDSNDAIIVAEAISPDRIENRRATMNHIVLPCLLLLVALLGGIRFDGVDGSILFLRPALICLIFAAGILILFFRAGLIDFRGWMSERSPMLMNVANGITLIALFFAAVQLFNSLLPEQGLPFWIVGFCFFWTLWTNLFAELEAKKMLRSLTAMFALGFAVKYLLLANFAKPANEGWISSIINDPGKTAATWLLDLPQFSPATGYLQFFTLAIFVIAFYFIPRTIED